MPQPSVFVTDVYGLDGKPIELTAKEATLALRLQRQYDNEMRNTLGFDLPITTLTAISKSIVEQKFFEIAPADYIPIRVGENAWSDQIMQYLSYDVAGDFETGNLNTGSNDTRMAAADTGINSLYNPVIDWGKTIQWSYIDLRKAARSGNWDIIASKERSRKQNWDLGIQKIAFQGSSTDTRVLGLLNQPNVNSNLSLITGYISTMNATNFNAFVAGLVGAFRSNCNYTAYPSRFVIPELDYNGLGSLVPGTAGTFPMTKLQYLLDAFRLITRNPNFQIMPLAYADQVNNSAGINKNRYTLYNYNEDSGRMDIPVDYTNTLQGTINNFQFQNVGFGEYTGFLAYRPLEFLYFDF